MVIWQFREKFYRTLEDSYESAEIPFLFKLIGEAYFNMTRVDMALAPNTELSEEEESKAEEALQRLVKHEPIQYVLGETKFYGLPFKVDKNVLIPRPETEELVEWICRELQEERIMAPKILDIGTGSGCIAIALAKNVPMAEVTAIDVSGAALHLAKKNAALNGVSIKFRVLDVLKIEDLTDTYDVIVSNPPYVRELEKHEMKPNVLNNEPEVALFVKDENPLLFYEKITKLAKSSLTENGKVFFEINQYLGKETEALLEQASFQTELRKDFSGNYRMLRGKL